jgi:hypothetical protein
MILSRRKLLMSAATLSTAVVAGCATNPTTGQPELDPAVIDAVQSGVAAVAQYIPAVESIAATAASLFGPGYAALVQVGSSALNALIQALAGLVTNLTPPASARLHARLRAAGPNVPVVIGKIGGVTVVGYRV